MNIRFKYKNSKIVAESKNEASEISCLENVTCLECKWFFNFHNNIINKHTFPTNDCWQTNIETSLKSLTLTISIINFPKSYQTKNKRSILVRYHYINNDCHHDSPQSHASFNCPLHLSHPITQAIWKKKERFSRLLRHSGACRLRDIGEEF